MGYALAMQAVAEASLKLDREALWHWDMAQVMVPNLRAELVQSYSGLVGMFPQQGVRWLTSKMGLSGQDGLGSRTLKMNQAIGLSAALDEPVGAVGDDVLRAQPLDLPGVGVVLARPLVRCAVHGEGGVEAGQVDEEGRGFGELDDQRVVFENPEHDWPQRLSYEIHQEKLHLRAEGLETGSRVAQWQLERVK